MISPSAIIKATEAATGSAYRPGNSLVLLQNGKEIFPPMLEAIKLAEHSIEFSTYVYWRSDIANQFADALMERAAAGVTVRLLVDAVGGAVMDSRTFWRLERAGVRVAWFRPVRMPYLHRFNNRSHRKILVVDGALGFTGGVGIAAEWTGGAQDKHHWRETHCQLVGPACADLWDGFAENWLEATGERLRRHQNNAHPEEPGTVAVQTTISTAAGHRPTDIDRLFVAAFAAATKQLWITTAYFVPSNDVVAALVGAAGRGVDVRLLTNGPATNHKVTRFAGRDSYRPLLEAGIKIYEYRTTVLHAKIITVDGTWATLGSANLDARSLVHNDELNIAFTEPALIAQLDESFETDLARSRLIKAKTWQNRGWLERLAERATRLIRHQL